MFYSTTPIILLKIHQFIVFPAIYFFHNFIGFLSLQKWPQLLSEECFISRATQENAKSDSNPSFHLVKFKELIFKGRVSKPQSDHVASTFQIQSCVKNTISIH